MKAHVLKLQLVDVQARFTIQNSTNGILMQKLENAQNQLGYQLAYSSKLQEQVSELQKQLHIAITAMAEIRQAYEHSTSWRVTWPIRIVKRLFGRK